MSGPYTASGLIIQYYQGNAALVAVCPQIFLGEIPEYNAAGAAIQLPFCVLTILDEIPEWTTENVYYDTVKANFKIYSNSAQQSDNIAYVLTQAFDWQGFVLSMRTTKRTSDDFVRDRYAQIVFMVEVEYTILIIRRLTN